MPPITRSSRIRAAPQYKVFHTPELLELILLSPEISNIDVFVAQRVDKAFNNIILGSKKLQSKMYGQIANKSDDELNSDLLDLLIRRFQKGSFMFWKIITISSPPGLVTMNCSFVDLQDIPGQRPLPEKELGWQGKTRVHIGGSWTDIEMGIAKDRLMIQVRSGGHKFGKTFTIGADGKLGDLFAALNDIRNRRR